jgi:transcriptional regulator with XRE-family HTH domain
MDDVEPRAKRTDVNLNVLMKFGEKITKLRDERDLTEIAFAKLVGVSNNTVSRWERGKNIPQKAVRIRIADALGISMDELTKGTDL